MPLNSTHRLLVNFWSTVYKHTCMQIYTNIPYIKVRDKHMPRIYTRTAESRGRWKHILSECSGTGMRRYLQSSSRLTFSYFWVCVCVIRWQMSLLKAYEGMLVTDSHTLLLAHTQTWCTANKVWHVCERQRDNNGQHIIGFVQTVNCLSSD